ncbi:hypothetical protein B9P99_04240 [Candidatus Marsarchaeota G1 archaeon OSP_B]|jgi:DNA-binding transcriptional regulator PaaX|uniref:Uncharacterized protein n=4 Tax=Candidatus Marsarchaeota group 1 TaxID=2203770 RepID=A0A2R6AKL7_9ARCH|nr:MAG: hypothetical protein B9Q01_00515 [Candidatus Marsarchaeota G1 archaeon OSP_D]PSN86929.1 MAG: hypothetical protein B9Q02_00575 [Candidatus Marsarchaeota G1 archaeon BE_D]PSN89591.1 MAG: hypothetical protein B9Q00_00985 [Candidatus Marsarchaeota G1 archaeon OSP_C]PSN91143.1 MAG: hypothetical protein B9P99_04240 [Candidatus Marsarchaeota G1 archaeon OSP_B]
MVQRLIQTEKLERFIYEYLLEKGSAVTLSELKEALKRFSGISDQKIRHAIMKLEMYGFVVTYERKENDLTITIKERP